MRSGLAKILLALGASAILGSCGIPKPPSLQLPKPVEDLRAIRKGDKVYLFWQVPTLTTDELAVRSLGSTKICRASGDAIPECQSPVGQASPPPIAPASPSNKKKPAAPPVQASYVDTLPASLLQNSATAEISYAIAVTNDRRRDAGPSNVVQVPAARTLPAPESFRAQVASDGVTLQWEPVSAPPPVEGIAYACRLYRQAEDAKQGNPIAEVPLSTTQFVDHTFEWQKRYRYRANVVTLITRLGKPNVEVEGDDTPVVEVYADDVFPPAVPAGLQAVFSGAGQAPFIDLIWAPVTDADLAGYNVYRHEIGQEPVKINSALVKPPAYRDSTVAPGKRYFYAVSAVDLRGNESARSEEASEQVP